MYGVTGDQVAALASLLAEDRERAMKMEADQRRLWMTIGQTASRSRQRPRMSNLKR
jgi:hypothetical protein